MFWIHDVVVLCSILKMQPCDDCAVEKHIIGTWSEIEQPYQGLPESIQQEETRLHRLLTTAQMLQQKYEGLKAKLQHTSGELLQNLRAIY